MKSYHSPGIRAKSRALKIAEEEKEEKKEEKEAVSSKELEALPDCAVFGVANRSGSDCFVCAIVSATMNLAPMRVLFNNIAEVKLDVLSFVDTNQKVGLPFVPEHTVRKARLILGPTQAKDRNPQQDADTVLNHLLNEDLKERSTWFAATQMTRCKCTDENCGYVGRVHKELISARLVQCNEKVSTSFAENVKIADSKCDAKIKNCKCDAKIKGSECHERCGQKLRKYTLYKWGGGAAFFFVCLKRAKANEEWVTIEEELVNVIDEKEVCVGVLHSAVCYLPHSEKGERGHYVAVLRQARDGPWYLVDDHKVKVLEGGYHLELLKRAAILFYMRPNARKLVSDSLEEEKKRRQAAEAMVAE